MNKIVKMTVSQMQGCDKDSVYVCARAFQIKVNASQKQSSGRLDFCFLQKPHNKIQFQLVLFMSVHSFVNVYSLSTPNLGLFSCGHNKHKTTIKLDLTYEVTSSSILYPGFLGHTNLMFQTMPETFSSAILQSNISCVTCYFRSVSAQ